MGHCTAKRGAYCFSFVSLILFFVFWFLALFLHMALFYIGTGLFLVLFLAALAAIDFGWFEPDMPPPVAV
jgi:hypothetical protein